MILKEARQQKLYGENDYDLLERIGCKRMEKRHAGNGSLICECECECAFLECTTVDASYPDDCALILKEG